MLEHAIEEHSDSRMFNEVQCIILRKKKTAVKNNFDVALLTVNILKNFPVSVGKNI